MRAIYFEYVRKWIGRYGDPDEVLDLLEFSGFRIFYCRRHDLSIATGAVQRLQIAGAPDVIDVLEVDRGNPPEETDLLAVHRSAVQSLVS